MNFKKITIVFLLFSGSIYGQTKPDSVTVKKANEIYIEARGVLFSGSLGVQFKRELKPDLFFKVGGLSLNGATSTRNQYDENYYYSRLINDVYLGEIENKNAAFSFNIGVEKRKVVTNTFSYFCGISLISTTLNYSYKYAVLERQNMPPNLFIPTGKSISYKESMFAIGLSPYFGAIFKIYKNLSASIEIAPSILRSYSKKEFSSLIPQINTQGWNYNLTTNSVGFNLVYRW
jgi:hypothetical protein